MKRFICSRIVTGMVLTSLVLGSAQAQPFVPPFTQDGVLSYLENIITLQQDINALQVDPDSARETILSETMRQSMVPVTQHGFEFARAQAPLLEKQPAAAPDADAATPADNATRQSEIEKFTQTVTQRITSLQKDLAIVNARIRRTPARLRSSLLSRQQALTGELNLAKAQMDLIGSIKETVQNASDVDTSSDLIKKIDNLNRSVVSLTPATATDAKTAAGDASKTPAASTAESTEKAVDNRSGLVHLGSDLFALWKKQSQLRVLKQDLNDLRTQTKDMRAQLRDTLQTMAKSGNTLAQDGGDKRTLDQQRQDFDTLVSNFKQLSASVVPLSQTSTSLDAAKQTLKDWQVLNDSLMKAVARQFMWHLALLAVAIAVPLALSEVARRATMLYVKDTRRQRQLRLLRRILFTIAIALIIALNLASEFGSLATFAGFLTAGIAVALQNILLSLVAHFFFFGRYGVRAGDRVTVGGVTGDVTQVGMVRLYLMEIEGTGDETRPTGRIVAFPNSILFQPTAFFKHMPA